MATRATLVSARVSAPFLLIEQQRVSILFPGIFNGAS